MATDGRWRSAASSLVFTRRGIGFLVGTLLSLILAPVLSLPAMLYVTGLLLALVLLNAIFVFVGHSKVRIERSFTPQIVLPGTLSRATIRITNLSVVPCLEARWEDRLPRGISGEAMGRLPALGGSRSATSQVTFSYDLQGLRRGRHDIGPVQVDVQDPFGLVYRRHTFGATEVLTVLPRVADLPPIRPRGSSEDGATRPAPQNVGVGDDDVIARTYLPGDALKRVHWKATAHRAELMVRQEEQQITPRAALWLDVEPMSQGTARDRSDQWEHSPSLEWCVVAAASISAHLVRAGYVVTVQTNGQGVDRFIADGHDTLEDAMVDLAVLTPQEHDHDGAAAVAERTTFAVLGRLDMQRARHWVTTLSTSRSIMAFVGHGTRDDVLDLLHGARWNVVTYAPNDDLADCWTRFDQAYAHVAP